MKFPSTGLVLLFALAIALTSCGRSAVERNLAAESLYDEAFTGYSVVDVVTGETLLARQSDRLFTPASNTKILTLATALAYLPADSLPAVAYRVDGDTLRLWATAYPLLGADAQPYNKRIRNRLGQHDGPVEVNLHGFNLLSRFGSGWMWDDFVGLYARERSGMPLYANLASAWREGGERFTARPSFVVVNTSEAMPKGRLSRKENSNRFTASAKTARRDTVSAPLFNAQALTAQLLEDWSGRPIRYHDVPLPKDWRMRTWPGLPRDTLLRAMMLPSDNFLAEQVFLQSVLIGRGQTLERRARTAARREVFSDLEDDQLRWVDASGLSHYNLISPAGLTQVLNTLHQRHDWGLLRRLFPTGGEPASTLANYYAPEPGERPWLWAKTGTLRHNHCLSGYLLADSGRLLAFSFMHNHYAGTSSAYKIAMTRSLRQIRSAY